MLCLSFVNYHLKSVYTQINNNNNMFSAYIYFRDIQI